MSRRLGVVCVAMAALAALAPAHAAPLGHQATHGTYRQFVSWNTGTNEFYFWANLQGTLVISGKVYAGAFRIGDQSSDPIGIYDFATDTSTVPNGPLVGDNLLGSVRGTCSVSWPGRPLPPYPPNITFDCFGSVNGGTVGARDLRVIFDDPDSFCNSSCSGLESKTGRYRGLP